MSGDSSYKADKVQSTHSMLLMLLLALVAGSAYLNYTISLKQQYMNNVLSEAQKQYGRAEHIGMLMSQYMTQGDSNAMEALKTEASEAFARQDNVGAWIRSTMPASPIDPSGQQKQYADGVHALDMLIQHAWSFVSAPDARDHADQVMKLAATDVPQYFPTEIGYFAAAKQKEIVMLTNISYGLCGFILVIALYQGYMLFNPAVRYIVRLLEHIDHMAATDTLTGFYNRTMLFKVAATLISGAKRHKHELAVLAADIDNFKAVNETYGRAQGDAAIRAVAEMLKEVLRTSDVVGRVAGQEFGIFLPSTDEYRAALVAEKLRAAIEDMNFKIKEQPVALRISIGVADLQGHHKNPDDMLRAAEAALKKAKDEGRNRVVTNSGRKAGDGAPAAPVAAAAPKAV